MLNLFLHRLTRDLIFIGWFAILYPFNSEDQSIILGGLSILQICFLFRWCLVLSTSRFIFLGLVQKTYFFPLIWWINRILGTIWAERFNFELRTPKTSGCTEVREENVLIFLPFWFISLRLYLDLGFPESICFFLIMRNLNLDRLDFSV